MGKGRNLSPASLLCSRATLQFDGDRFIVLLVKITQLSALPRPPPPGPPDAAFQEPGPAPCPGGAAPGTPPPLPPPPPGAVLGFSVLEKTHKAGLELSSSAGETTHSNPVRDPMKLPDFLPGGEIIYIYIYKNDDFFFIIIFF